jgi:ElaB/YqjD/DUF883 family membrane-anchored ribosome-binding protein
MANPDRSAASRDLDKPLGAVEDIQRDMQLVREDLARLAQQVGALLGATGSDALRRAKQGFDGVMADAGEKSLDAVDAVRDQAHTVLEALEDAVHKRPFATLGLALGLGFLFGATWRR